MKMKYLILASLLLLLLSIGMASANENTTVESVDANEDLGDFDDEINAKIIAHNVTQEYDPDNELKIKIVDNDNQPIEGADVYLDDYLSPYFDFDGKYYFYPDLDAGNHEVEFSLDDGLYKAEPVVINVKILKSTFYGDIDCKSYIGTTKTKLTMKATVTDSEGYLEDGYVTFKVNGHSYKVKTKNGVAKKTIKIKKAGTYTYTAKFTSGNFKDSVTGKGKLYVKKARKYYTFKAKKFKNSPTTGELTYNLPYKYYVKLLNARNKAKTCSLDFKTNIKVKGFKWFNTLACFYLEKNGKLRFTYNVVYEEYPAFAAKTYNLYKAF